MELLFSKPSRPVVDKNTLLVEKEPYISLKMRRRPELVEIVGRINVLLNEDVFIRRRLVFAGIVRGADILSQVIVFLYPIIALSKCVISRHLA